jgi:hypothetical protein
MDLSEAMSTAEGRPPRPWHREGAPPGDLTVTEAFQLEAFCDGAIMCLEIRQHLWRSWGLCHRHAWGYVIVEFETRLGRPFSTSILYDDLLRRALAVVASRLPWRQVLKRLRRRACCLTCDYVNACSADFVPRDDLHHTAVLNRFRSTAAALEHSWDEAVSRACPACLGGTGPVCRRHLLAGIDVDRQVLKVELEALYRRMLGLHRSMPWGGPPADAAMQASWIEALGWFGGWGWPFGERDEGSTEYAHVR